jgi:hypothetical protein
MTSDVSARVRALFPLDEATAEVWTGKLGCDWCRLECSVVVGVRVSVGRYETFFSLAELGQFQLEREVCAALGPIARAHVIDWRDSPSRGNQVLSNGCPQCRSMLGETVDLGPWACREKIGAFTLELCAMWRRAMFAPGDERERVRVRYPDVFSK